MKWKIIKLRSSLLQLNYLSINMINYLFGWEWKNGEMEKTSLNKFTHILLLKNNVQLKQKKWQIITKEKNQSPEFIKKKKSCIKKKSTSS